MYKDAILSENKRYRYMLTRIWDESKPMVMWVMLNPSTADASNDDPTIRKCIAFAKSWGYGGIYVGNLFAFRATNPKRLLQITEPIGAENEEYIRMYAEKVDKVICAWGNPVIIDRIWQPVLRKVLTFEHTKLHYLALCKDGETPKHPLYLNSKLVPVAFLKKEVGGGI
ncbi:MAG: DUF1643 domain-containing protein [Runella slithyformis]|nr:MAG: DUF1643 domain-containing protein [Runella slithyformis]